MEVNEEEMTDTDMDVASELIDWSPVKSVVSSQEKRRYLTIKVEDTKDDSNETELPEVASELISSTDCGEVADEAEE